MRQYFPLITGVFAIGVEVLVFLALMEIPPFGKGDSDIIWGLPCFFLVVLGFTVSGILSAITLKNKAQSNSKLVVVGLALNGLSLAIPILLLFFSVIRAFL